MKAEVVGDTIVIEIDGKPGYLPIGSIAEVKCDGAVVPMPFAFDTEAGWVKHFGVPPEIEGEPGNERVRTHRREGVVEFALADGLRVVERRGRITAEQEEGRP
jgi:hypothetical protein